MASSEVWILTSIAGDLITKIYENQLWIAIGLNGHMDDIYTRSGFHRGMHNIFTTSIGTMKFEWRIVPGALASCLVRKGVHLRRSGLTIVELTLLDK